jgi:D-tyrosyl-tRNA(Tyr) deacylase
LLADTSKGRRPSYLRAAPPDRAEQLYERLAAELRKRLTVATGRFQAHMRVSLTNDGPVTIVLDSR